MLIRRWLNLAFVNGERKVRTYTGTGGGGILRRRRLADLSLPSGEILLGYPGSPLINVPSPVRPRVDAGNYPVFLSTALKQGHENWPGFAYLSVCFSEERVARWKAAGHFFTDSAIGCVMDSSLVEQFRFNRGKSGIMAPLESMNFKLDTLRGANDGSILLDKASGANAIVWYTGDGAWKCFTGYGSSGRIVCLVIDGTRPSWWEFWR